MFYSISKVSKFISILAVYDLTEQSSFLYLRIWRNQLPSGSLGYSHMTMNRALLRIFSLWVARTEPDCNFPLGRVVFVLFWFLLTVAIRDACTFEHFRVRLLSFGVQKWEATA